MQIANDLKFSELQPGDVISAASGYISTVLSVSKSERQFSTITCGLDTVGTEHFDSTRSGKVWIDVIVERRGKEIYRGWKYNQVRELCKSDEKQV